MNLMLAEGRKELHTYMPKKMGRFRIYNSIKTFGACAKNESLTGKYGWVSSNN